MPLFRCEKCGCIENTAVSNFHTRNIVRRGLPKPNNPALCSECDPEIGVWHGHFEKKSAKGFLLCSDGFIRTKKELEMQKDNPYFKSITVIKEITE